MNLYQRFNELFHTKPQGIPMSLSIADQATLESVAAKLLPQSTVETIMSHFITSIINEIAAHSIVISNMHLQDDVTPDELDAAYKKLLALLNVLSPVMDIVAANFPALLPIVKMAESYAAVSQS